MDGYPFEKLASYTVLCVLTNIVTAVFIYLTVSDFLQPDHLSSNQN